MASRQYKYKKKVYLYKASTPGYQYHQGGYKTTAYVIAKDMDEAKAKYKAFIGGDLADFADARHGIKIKLLGCTEMNPNTKVRLLK